MTKHKISIVVPVYNCTVWLEECVNSILDQNVPVNFETQIVLVDDGSSDNSGEKCDVLADGQDNIVVIHQSNRGVSVARNEGIKASDGDWICFVDGDDVLKNGAFKILENQNVAGCDIVRYGAYIFGENSRLASFGKKYSSDKDEYIKLVVRRTAMLGVWGAFYKRKLFFENDIFFQQGVRIGEDWMILFKLLLKAKSFIYVNQDLYGYRMNDCSVTRKLVSTVRPDALIALNYILDFAKANNYPVTKRDIAIARSDIRRNMMKEAILNRNKAFFKETDEAIGTYAPQSFWKDVLYSRKIKHKIGFIIYWLFFLWYKMK